MDVIFTFILTALAVYRVARMVALEDGPFALWARMRGWIGDRWGAEHWLTLGMNCPLCVGFWLAAVGTMITNGTPFVAYWLALAGAQALLQKTER